MAPRSKEAAVDLFVTFHSGEERITVSEPLPHLCHLEEAMDVVIVPSDPRRVVVLVTRVPDAGGDLEMEHHHFLDERAPGMEHRHLTGNEVRVPVDVEVRRPERFGDQRLDRKHQMRWKVRPRAPISKSTSGGNLERAGLAGIL